MRRSTIADYNSKDRALEFCVDIYFNGVSQEPLHCTRDNYLIDCDLLDEACSDTDTFIGAPSSNEVSFQLFGSSGLFNPNKLSGPYYGKIKVGVLIKVYCRPIGTDEQYEWDPLGEFYVTDWQTDITGVTADVVANDRLYALFNSEVTKLEVKPNYSYGSLALDFFESFGVVPVIVGDLTELLTFAYIDGTNSDFIRTFAVGAVAFIFCDHYGHITIQDIDRRMPIDFTLTDNDQIISVKSKQSAIFEYDGVSITYNRMQISDEVEVLSAHAQTIGPNETKKFLLQSTSKAPLYVLDSSSIVSEASCKLTKAKYSPIDISYVVKNITPLEKVFDVLFTGYVIEAVKVSIDDEGDNVLRFDNIYVQNEVYAARLKELLTKYIHLKVPVLELEVRGNPLINIGSKLHIVSSMYELDFTGILIRQQFKYDGGLSATMHILSSEIIDT